MIHAEIKYHNMVISLVAMRSPSDAPFYVVIKDNFAGSVQNIGFENEAKALAGYMAAIKEELAPSALGAKNEVDQDEGLGTSIPLYNIDEWQFSMPTNPRSNPKVAELSLHQLQQGICYCMDVIEQMSQAAEQMNSRVGDVLYRYHAGKKLPEAEE